MTGPTEESAVGVATKALGRLSRDDTPPPYRSPRSREKILRIALLFLVATGAGAALAAFERLRFAGEAIRIGAVTPDRLDGGVLNVAGNGDSAIPPDGATAAHSPLACPAALHFDAEASELVIREAAQFRTIDKDGVLRTGGIGGKTVEELCKITGSGFAVTEDKNYLVARPTFVYTFGGDIVFYPPEGPNANPPAFEEIRDIAYDPQSKSIYVADKRRIKRIALPDGTITTMAGTGSDEASETDGKPLETALGEVQALAVDRRGNVYFAAGYPPIIRAFGAPSGE